MPLDLSSIPIVDNHCHSLLREQPPDDEAFRIHLTESYFPEVARDHVPHSLFYQWTLRELAGLLDVEPTPDAVHAARRERGLEWLTREVVERGNFKTWLIDTGYGAEMTFGLDELRFAECAQMVGDVGLLCAGLVDYVAHAQGLHGEEPDDLGTQRFE